MHFIDVLIIVVYLVVILGIGFYFFRKNKDIDEYYVGGRSLSSFHIGLFLSDHVHRRQPHDRREATCR